MLEKKDAQQFFAWPVTDKIAPGYSSIIKQPMDFSTIKSRIENESYTSLSEFAVSPPQSLGLYSFNTVFTVCHLQDDFKLMCNNAMTYNQPDTIYFKAAKKLLQSGLKILSPEKIKSLVPLIPSIRFLTEEHLGAAIFDSPSHPNDQSGDGSHSDEDIIDLVCLDPTKSVHYMPPHPNDPP